MKERELAGLEARGRNDRAELKRQLREETIDQRAYQAALKAEREERERIGQDVRAMGDGFLTERLPGLPHDVEGQVIELLEKEEDR